MRTFLEAFRMHAVNTWWDVGPTWCSTRGKWHRIDYVLVGEGDLTNVISTEVHHDIDLTLNASEDHKPVSACVLVHPPKLADADNKLTSKAAHFKVNKCNLADPDRCARFQADVWAFQPHAGSSMNGWLEQLNDVVRNSARRCFGRPNDVPRQAWLSPLTWSIIKLIAPCTKVYVRRTQIVPRRSSSGGLLGLARWLTSQVHAIACVRVALDSCGQRHGRTR